MTSVPVPILLVAGFLGAGKTTVVNHLLANAEGRRIAAVVNDFGAINIDAALIAGASDGVVSLSNGCICCSLEGDLLRTLAALLRRTPRPERIVIETSGVADPGDIARNLMDPVIWREAPLETVLCVLDAGTPAVARTPAVAATPAGSGRPTTAGTGTPAALDDPLLRSQLRAADVVALSKPDLVEASRLARLREAVRAIRPGAVVVEALHGAVPAGLLFAPELDGSPPPREPAPRHVGRRLPAADRFQALGWTSDHPVSLRRFQAAIGRLAPRLARAKGVLETLEQPGRPLVFQFAGGRATLAQAGTTGGVPSAPAGSQVVTPQRTRVVFVAELGVLSAEEVDRAMDACVDPPGA